MGKGFKMKEGLNNGNDLVNGKVLGIPEYCHQKYGQENEVFYHFMV